jgi:hypothetical protein
VIKEKRPLDWDAVLASPVPLKVVASCLDTLQPIILDRFTSPRDLGDCPHLLVNGILRTRPAQLFLIVVSLALRSLHAKARRALLQNCF